MAHIFFTLLLAFFLSFIFMFLGFLVSKKSFFQRSFMSPFECGFLPKKISMPTFTIRFFILALVFLIFDVELVLLFPYMVFFQKSMSMSLISLIFLINIFSLGLLYEWNLSMLDWID